MKSFQWLSIFSGFLFWKLSSLSFMTKLYIELNEFLSIFFEKYCTSRDIKHKKVSEPMIRACGSGLQIGLDFKYVKRSRIESGAYWFFGLNDTISSYLLHLCHIKASRLRTIIFYKMSILGYFYKNIISTLIHSLSKFILSHLN